MTTRRSRELGGLLVALVLLAAALAVLLAASPAQAARVVVTLGPGGPSPDSASIVRGDVVRFQNGDGVAHTVERAAGPWVFKKTIAAGAFADTPAFNTAGTYTYTDSFTLVAVPRTVNGTIVVKAATASPTASPKPSPRRSTAPTRSPAPRPSASASAAPTQTGVAVGPGIGPGVVIPPTPTPSGVPRPDIAGPLPSPALTSAGPGVVYSERGLVQGSPHRYGLPAALAVVGITGVVSLLVRLLLAEPAARRRRTAGPEVTVTG